MSSRQNPIYIRPSPPPDDGTPKTYIVIPDSDFEDDVSSSSELSYVSAEFSELDTEETELEREMRLAEEFALEEERQERIMIRRMYEEAVDRRSNTR